MKNISWDEEDDGWDPDKAIYEQIDSDIIFIAETG